MQTILLVEDDAAVAAGLLQGLTEEGYLPVRVKTAAQARTQFSQKKPALVLLDLGLPDEDGMLLLPFFREADPDLPVVILSARDGIDERVTGLDRGAVDYILKPFALPELLARIRLQLRRSGVADASVLRVGGLQMDLLARKVSREGELLELPPREFDLLLTLMRNAGKPVSREQISREVWHAPRRMSSLDNLIDVHVSRLRDRLKPVRIQTIRGVGYLLEAGEAP